MEKYHSTRRADGGLSVRCPHRGSALLNHPMYNKSTGFTLEERERFGLTGLLPPSVSTMQQQAQRVYANIRRKGEALERYIGLAALQDRNEHLFYRVLADHIEELMPIVYTPTVGQACKEYSHIFRRTRGLWITPEHRGRIREVLGNAPFADVRLIVVTDNERILGLGDQGAGGMGIPIGKLALYTLAAGIHPSQTLPISLDVGTDNRELLAEPLYLGWHHPRLRGEEYYSLVEEFIQAVKEQFPGALLQWEDFKKKNAFVLLDRYREVLPSFNDDIQGTAGVALAGVLAAARITGIPLREHRVVTLGAGAAGIGIARQLRAAFARDGMSAAALTRSNALLDSGGLLIDGRVSDEPYKDEFAWPRELAAELGLSEADRKSLVRVIDAVKPNVLIGTSGQPGVFTEEVVRTMARHCARPVIMPFSNPTSQSEGIPADILRWTDGRALVATGSPFDAVGLGGRTIRIGQGNNVYIFPGVGLGVLVAQARQVTDAMFTVAAQSLADSVSQADLDSGSLYPPLTQLRAVTARIAEAVAREAQRSGLARARHADIGASVRESMWEPAYPTLEPA